MNPKYKLPKVPPVSRTLKRLRAGPELDNWWNNVSEADWDALQEPQQAPPKAQPEKEKTPPKDEPPKTGKAPRSRVGRVQIRPNQVGKNRIRKVKPTALRVENMGVARDMLGRVDRSGKPQSPKVVYMKI